MVLAHDVVGARDGRTAVIVHGILGSKSNWRSFAHKLHEAAPGWRIVTVDVRNHGESHGALAPHTIASCADDVLATVPSFDLVIGHSFGGKIALELARRAAGNDQQLREAWILDCPPGARSLAGSEVLRVLEAALAVPMPVTSRKDLVEALRARGLSEPLAQWMTTNLRPLDGGGFTWRFAAAAIPQMLASFAALDLWSVLEQTAGPRMVMVRGGRSDRFSAIDLSQLALLAASGCVVAHALPSAGHWLHTDDPQGLLDLLAPALHALAPGQ